MRAQWIRLTAVQKLWVFRTFPSAFLVNLLISGLISTSAAGAIALEYSRLQQSVDGAPPFGSHRADGITAIAMDPTRQRIVVAGITFGSTLFAEPEDSSVRDPACFDPVEQVTGNPSAIIECRDRTGELAARHRNAFIAIYSNSGELIHLELFGSIDGLDEALAVAVDDRDGSILVGGRTSSHRFPVSRNDFEPSTSGRAGLPSFDGFLARMSPSGRFESARLIGGPGDDAVHGVAINGSGDIFVAGRTESPELEASLNAHGGRSDAFAARLEADLNLSWLRYIGGSQGDWATGIAVDRNRLFVAGNTRSPRLGTTGTVQSRHGGGLDGFIQLLSPDGDPRAFTYLGVAHQERLFALTLDSGGRPVVGGDTTPPRSLFDGGATSGPGILSSSVTGGMGLAGLMLDIEIEPRDNGSSGPMIPGDVSNLPGVPIPNIRFALPISTDAAQSQYGGGSHDGWVAGLTPNLDRLRFLTYLGGAGEDRVMGLAAHTGQLFAIGSTRSEFFPTTDDAVFTEALGGSGDVFLTGFSNDGRSITTSSLLGGSGADRGAAIAVDVQGRLYVAGETFGCTLPLSDPPLPCRTTEGFLSRLSPDQLVRSDLALILDTPTHAGGIAIPEDEVEIRLQVRNHGPQAAAGVEFELEMPRSLMIAVQSVRGADCVESDGDQILIFQCRVPFMEAFDESIELLFVTRPDPSQVHTIDARVSSRTRDLDLSNNQASLDLVSLGRLQLSITDAELTQGIQDLFFKSPTSARSSQNFAQVSGTREQGSTPMIEGKPTVLRVYMRATRDGNPVNITGLDAGLRIERNGTTLATQAPMTAVGTLPGTPNRSSMASSINFNIPTELTRGRVHFLVDVSVAVGVETLEPFPLDLLAEFWTTPPICLKTFPVRGTGGTLPARFLLDNTQGQRIQALAESLLPTADLHIFPSSHVFEELEVCLALPPLCFGPYEMNEQTEMAGIFTKLWVYDQGSNDPSFCDDRLARTHYGAIIRGGDLRLPINGSASNCSVAADQLVVEMNLGRRGAPTAPSILPSGIPQAGGTLAHELSHNYCRSHIAACTAAGTPVVNDTDRNYPFNPCSFTPTVNRRSFFGFDPLSLTPISPPVLPITNANRATVVGDLMSTETDRWTSSYQWGAIHNRLLMQYRDFFTLPPDTDQMFLRQAWTPRAEPVRIAQVGGDVAQPDLSAKSPLLPERLLVPLDQLPISKVDGLPPKVLLVHGVIGKQTSVKIQSVERSFLPDEKLLRLLHATQKTDPGKARVQVELLDNRDRVLETARLTPTLLADSEPESHMFSGAISIPEGPSLSAVRVSVDGKTVLESKRSTPPTVRLLSPSSASSFKDQIKVVWKSKDVDTEAADLRAIVQYSPDGERWQVVADGLSDASAVIDASDLPGGDHAKIRIWVDDGFDTGMAESQPFRVGEKAPRVSLTIAIPDVSGQKHPQVPAGIPLVFRAKAWDAEQGYLTHGFRWMLDAKPLKHSGKEIELRELPPGSHTVTVTAIDQNGQKSSTKLGFRVRSVRRIISFGGDDTRGRLRLHDLVTGESKEIALPKAISTAATDGDLLITAGPDLRLGIWQLQADKLPRLISSPSLPSEPTHLKLVASTAVVIVGHKQPKLMTFGLSQLNRPLLLEEIPLSSPVRGLARSGDSLIVAHGSHVDLLRLRSGRSMRTIERLTGGDPAIALADADSSSSTVAALFADGTVKLLEPGPRSLNTAATGSLDAKDFDAEDFNAENLGSVSLSLGDGRLYLASRKGLMRFRTKGSQKELILSTLKDFPTHLRQALAFDGEIHVLDSKAQHWSRKKPSQKATLSDQGSGLAGWVAIQGNY